MEKQNIFASIPKQLNEELFDTLFLNEKIKIERIISKGHSSPNIGWYDQEKDEWIIVLNGAAVIAFENDERVSLVPGDYLNIPAHTRHKVISTNPDLETIWLAVHY